MDDVDRTDRDGCSALHMAALANDHERVEQLLDAGANADLPDKRGLVPLHFAAQGYALDAARCLLDAGAAVDLN